ncbi:vitellogenin-like [Oratosquilla oratoria]|uniref:vitellogenin-like n=1 Tax=Oratosquilla oratoria TaxID=337810 RepID=UPI003F7637BD
MARSLFLLTTLCFALFAHAYSYDGVRCSTECPVTGSPKLSYTPGQTYVYNQHGESNLHFENVENANTRVEWNSKVELSMLTPCDVAITIKEFQMNGKDASVVPEMGKVSERPLMMAIMDGRVQHVCVDPEDDTWSVNAKMSVASYLQNTLPSFSEVNKETTITERDIQGKCPTSYTLTPVSETDVQVVKEKDNKRCEDRFYRPAETMNNLPWLNMPLPLEESSSTCQQNVQSGLYTSIECTDTNILKPMYGVYKHIKAVQKATLQFESQVEVDPALLTFSSDHLVKKELKFDFTTPKKRDTVVPRLDAILTDICAKVENTVEPETAALVYHGMTLLRHAPDSHVKAILDNIRAGAYCPNWHKIEQMYLDAIAFLGESGAVPVMMEEISQGVASPGRTALYATALHMMARPNALAIKSLAPLVTMDHPPKTVLLAAASMVSTYIRQHPRYREEGLVDEIIMLATSKLAETCHGATPEEREHAKLLLKGLGNVGYFPEPVAATVKQCYHDISVETSVRVAAAQAFRKVPCNLWNPHEMLNHYYDMKEETEIRATAYLNGARCVEDMAEVKRIIDFAREETNIQIRSLVLTHLTNLQETDSPHKEHLRYLLSNIVLPADYSEDIRKFSRNTEISHFFRTIGLGAEVDSNLIYSRKSTLPRSVNFNLTTDIFGNMMNLAEVGVRLDGFNSLLEEVFGPRGYLMSTPWNKVITDIAAFGQNKGSKVVEHLASSLRAKRNVEFQVAEDFVDSKVRSRNHQEKQPMVDLALRLFGQEISFASLTSDLKNIDVDQVIGDFFAYMDHNMESMSKYLINTARTLPISLEYTIPTMQGIPLHADLCGAAVLGLDMDSDVDIRQILSGENPHASLKLMPSLSVELDGFVGFKSVLKHGVKVKNNLHISNGGKLDIDLTGGLNIKWSIPEKWDLISFKSETYMVNEEIEILNENPEHKIIPEGIVDARLVEKDECTDFFDSHLGLRFCYKLNLPNIISSTSVPFGHPIEISLTAEKTEASMEGYRLAALLTNEPDNKVIDFTIDTPGSSAPRGAAAKVSYDRKENTQTLFASISSSFLEYATQTTLTTDADKKALEMFWKYKIMHESGEYAYGFKTDMMLKTEDLHRKLDFNIYFSPSWEFPAESQMFEASVLSEMHEGNTGIDVVVRSHNALRNFIVLDFEAGFDFHSTPRIYFPLIDKLRKWNVHVEIIDWKLHQHIAPTAEAEDSAEWSAKFSLMKGEHVYFDIESLAKKNGIFPANLNIDVETTAIVGDIDLKSLNKLHYDGMLLETSWELDNRKTEEKIAHALLSITRKEEGKMSFENKLELQAPKLMERLDIVVHIDEVEESKYDLTGTAVYNEEMTYEAKGPVALKIKKKKWLQEMDLEILGFSEGPHRLTTALETSPKKKKVLLQLSDSTGILLNSMIDRTIISEEESDIKTSFALLKLTDTKADFHLSKEALHINFNSLLFPLEEYQRRIKGVYDRDFTTKTIKAEVFFDAEGDISKMIGTESNYDLAEDGLFNMHGNLILMGETHQYNMKAQLASPLRMFEGHNEVSLIWTTPAQRTFTFQTFLNKNTLAYEKSSMNGLIYFKTPDENDYEWRWDYVFENLPEPLNYKLDAMVTLKSPQIEEVISKIHAYHKLTPEAREVSFKTEISQNKLTEAMLLDIFGNLMENSYEAKIAFNHADKQTSIDSAKNDDGSMHLEMTKNDETYFNIRVHHPEPLLWNVRVETPSRTLEAVSSLDSSKPSVEVWTNKDKSEDKIEVSGNMISQEVKGTQGTRIEGKISYPTLSKDIMISAEYGFSPLTVVGSLELDIFQSHEDMVVLTLQGTKKSEGSYRTDVAMSTKALLYDPRIMLDTAWTKSTKGIELHYLYDPSVPEKMIALKYQRTMPEEAVLSAKLRTPSIDMEISNILRPEETIHCHGFNLNTHWSLQAQEYETKSHFCYPAHVEAVTFKVGEEQNKKYHLNAGWKSPGKVELDIRVEKPWENPLMRFADVAGIRAELTSPVTLDLEGHYHQEEVQENMNEILEIIRSQVNTFLGWWESTYQQLQADAASQSAELPVIEADKVFQYFLSEFAHIYEDLRTDGLIPDLVHIFQVAISEVQTLVSMFREVYHYLDESVVIIYSEYVDLMSKITKAYESEIMECLMEIRTVLLRLRELYEMNQFTPEEIVRALKETRFWEKIEGILLRLQETHPQEYQAIIDIWTTMEHRLNPVEMIGMLKENFPEQWEALTYVTRHIVEDVRKDAHIIYRQIMRRPFIRQTVDWFLHSFGFENIPQAEEVLHFLYQLLEDTLQLNYNAKQGKLRLVLPLNRPVYSLTTVPYGVSVSSGLPVWRSFVGLMQTVIPIQYKFFNALTSSPAIYYGDGSLYTFDGKMIKLPVTPCQYILATDGYDHVTVRALPDNKYEFGITLGNRLHKVVIDSEYKAYLDDQEQTEEEQSIYPYVTVYQRPAEVIVNARSLYLSVSKTSPTFRLYASVELMGRLEGLMGTLNNFEGDDMMMPNGELAPDAATFLSSWQLDSC